MVKHRFTGIARPLAPFPLSALQLTSLVLWVLSELSQTRRNVREKNEKELQMNKKMSVVLPDEGEEGIIMQIFGYLSGHPLN
jgi:hypothetical protein